MIIDSKMHYLGIDLKSYLFPLLFFVFTYYSGMLTVIPLINSIFSGVPVNTYIPIFSNNQQIPILVIQWGFLGGFTYSVINLLRRSLMADLAPRMYISASFQLIFSVVAAIVIYLLYMIINPQNSSITPPPILLFCFVAGAAPIQFLINLAESQLSKIDKGWKRRNTSGNKNIVQLQGIDWITANRLNEEGIRYIFDMALINPVNIAFKTKFDLLTIENWRDQAILFYLIGDVVVDISEKSSDNVSGKKHFLIDILNKRLGIHTISQLLEIWKYIKEDEKNLFFNSLGIIETNFCQLYYLFEILIPQGNELKYYWRRYNENIK
jgi:hypothetical protein